MSQRNPMNERYQTDKHQGKTRKSAASAKPKSKAAASVTYSAPKKDPREKKAEIKAQRKAETARQREIDRKYSTPDTERYKKLRRIFWAAMVGAILCVALSWLLRPLEPQWFAIVCLIIAYVLIIFAFYIDFSKIRKERRAYQTRMLAKEVEEKKAQEKADRAARAQQGKGKGGKGKGAKPAEANAEEAKEGEASDSNQEEEAPKKRKGLFSRKPKPETQE